MKLRVKIVADIPSKGRKFGDTRFVARKAKRAYDCATYYRWEDEPCPTVIKRGDLYVERSTLVPATLTRTLRRGYKAEQSIKRFCLKCGLAKGRVITGEVLYKPRKRRRK